MQWSDAPVGERTVPPGSVKGLGRGGEADAPPQATGGTGSSHTGSPTTHTKDMTRD